LPKGAHGADGDLEGNFPPWRRSLRPGRVILPPNVIGCVRGHEWSRECRQLRGDGQSARTGRMSAAPRRVTGLPDREGLMRFPNPRSAGSVRLQRYTHGSRRAAGGGRAPVKRIMLGGAIAIVLGSAALSVVVGYVANVPPADRRSESYAGHADPAVIAKLRVAQPRRLDPLPPSAVAAPVSPPVPDMPAGRPDLRSVPPRGRPTAASTSIRASISAEPVIAALQRPTTIASRISEATRFHVQVGVFTDRPSAEVIVQRLRALGFAVRLVGDRPFLVWVGGYLDRTTAESLRMHLHAVGIDATLAPG